MTSNNLAVCFLPSLFRITDFQQTTPPAKSSLPGAGSGVSSSPGSTTGTANPGAATDGNQLRYKSALTCLAALIANADYLLTVKC